MVKVWKKICLSICMFLLLFGVTVSAAEPENKNPYDNPQNFAAVENGWISADAVTPGDVLRYRFQIRDIDIKSYEGYGDGEAASVFKVVVTWKSEKKQEIVQTFDWKKDGTYSGKLSIAKGMRKGTWCISRIVLLPGEEDYDEMLTSKLEKLNGLTLYNQRYFPEKPAADLEFSQFVVSASGKADGSAPKVNVKSMTLTRKKSNGGQLTRFSVKVTDKSKIKYVRCTWQSRKKGVGLLHVSDVNLKYNKKKGCYQYSSQKKFETGEYDKLVSIEVCDIYGNKAVYRSSQKKYRKDFARMTVYPVK